MEKINADYKLNDALEKSWLNFSKCGNCGQFLQQSSRYSLFTSHLTCSFLCLFFSCPVDPYLNYKVSDSSYQRFSFDAFKMDDAEVMYLHCEVLVCASNEKNASRCDEGCVEDNPGGSRRKRRDETNQEKKEVTSLGPVKVLVLGLGSEGGERNLLDNQNSSNLF